MKHPRPKRRPPTINPSTLNGTLALLSPEDSKKLLKLVEEFNKLKDNKQTD